MLRQLRQLYDGGYGRHLSAPMVRGGVFDQMHLDNPSIEY